MERTFLAVSLLAFVACAEEKDAAGDGADEASAPDTVDPDVETSETAPPDDTEEPPDTGAEEPQGPWEPAYMGYRFEVGIDDDELWSVVAEPVNIAPTLYVMFASEDYFTNPDEYCEVEINLSEAVPMLPAPDPYWATWAFDAAEENIDDKCVGVATDPGAVRDYVTSIEYTISIYRYDATFWDAYFTTTGGTDAEEVFVGARVVQAAFSSPAEGYLEWELFCMGYPSDGLGGYVATPFAADEVRADTHGVNSGFYLAMGLLAPL